MTLHGGETGWGHAWAEFYLPGVEWVPTDVFSYFATKRCLRSENTSPEVAKEKEARTEAIEAFYFGNLDNLRIHIAPDAQAFPYCQWWNGEKWVGDFFDSLATITCEVTS